MSTPNPIPAAAPAPATAPAPSKWKVLAAALLHDARQDLLPPLTTFLASIQASRTDGADIATQKLKEAGGFAAMVGAWALSTPHFVADVEADAAGVVLGMVTPATPAS
jgi:hypothetical protein